MESNLAPRKVLTRVGIFTALGLLLIAAVTVYVNDRPYWWRPCDLVTIHVQDATGLKTKSPVRSLGLEIGYLQGVELTETHVKLGICITAPVEVLSETRAYIRGEGFLGDKFIELKPVRYLAKGERAKDLPEPSPTELPKVEKVEKSRSGARKPSGQGSTVIEVGFRSLIRQIDSWIPSAQADEKAVATGGGGGRSRTVPVGNQGQDMEKLINQVDDLVGQMGELTSNLKEAIDPKEMKRVMTQLNRTLENASKTLAPEGGLNNTAQRTLSKLEDAIEQLRDQMARVNRGEGSLGKLLNDPSYAQEIQQAVRSLNTLLGRASQIRFSVSLGVEQMPRYSGSRGVLGLNIWPADDRYYHLGVAVDPRGTQIINRTTTEAGGTTSVVKTTQVRQGGLSMTAMLGKIFLRRIDVSGGVLYGDGTGSLTLMVGPRASEDRYQVRTDVYSRFAGYGLDSRVSVQAQPFASFTALGNLYLRGGLDGFKKVDVDGARSDSGSLSWFVGAGVRFDDQNIRLLFTLL